MLVENQFVEVNGKMVDAKTLSHGSNKRVRVICDYCGKEYTMVYQKYYQRVLNGTVHKCACRQCEHFKIAESNLINYGTSSTNRLESVKQKKVQKYIEVFGAPNPMMNDEIKAKNKASLIEHYGENFQEIRHEKIKATMLERYGVDHPSKSKEILEKTRLANREKYGVDYPLSLDSVREKIAVTTYLNRTGKSSPEQERICRLLGGDLNFPIGRYLADILLEDNVIIELDGSGHKANVLYGNCTQEEFEAREKQREDFILSKGYKIIRFVHARHTVIKQDEYLQAYAMCKAALKNSNVVKYSFDEHKML